MSSLEEEMKLLQKHFGGVVKMIKELKGCVEALDKKVERKVRKSKKSWMLKVLLTKF
jgi:hypothetical protein